MVEIALLEAITQFLGSAPLAPVPATVGVAEPGSQADMPAVVLSLDSVQQPGNGLGSRSEVKTGALKVTFTINLTNPVLPSDPSFRLLSADRLTLILAHGGLVRADATEGPLSGTDISVKVAGTPRPIVNAAPAGSQVQPDPQIGQLLFATPLPASGLVEAQYNIGQWEQRIARASGTLRVAVRALASGTVRDLSDAVAAALDDPLTAVPGLQVLRLSSVSSIASSEGVLANSLGRNLLYNFEFEQEINRPESSGGVIRRIPIAASIS